VRGSRCAGTGAAVRIEALTRLAGMHEEQLHREPIHFGCDVMNCAVAIQV